jgi:hypothetical protein
MPSTFLFEGKVRGREVTIDGQGRVAANSQAESLCDDFLALVEQATGWAALLFSQANRPKNQ